MQQPNAICSHACYRMKQHILAGRRIVLDGLGWFGFKLDSSRLIGRRGLCRGPLGPVNLHVAPRVWNAILTGHASLRDDVRMQGANPGSAKMILTICRLVMVWALLSLGACVVYAPVPLSSQPTLQERLDRSWAAATGAMSDQGLTITSQDRGTGVIVGERGGITITATVEALADGRLQVKFASKGADGTDLTQRVSDSYDRRMGR